MDRNVLGITGAILIVSIFVGFYSIYLPKTRILRELEERQNEEREKQGLLDEMETLEKKVASYRKYWIPKGREEAELLSRIRDMANNTQIHVLAILPQPKLVSPRGYQKFPVTVTFGGTYHHLGDFVAKTESAEVFLKIERVSFTAGSKEGGETPALICDVTLSGFSSTP